MSRKEEQRTRKEWEQSGSHEAFFRWSRIFGYLKAVGYPTSIAGAVAFIMVYGYLANE